MSKIQINEFWILSTLGPRYYTAKSEDEHRIYYSRDALERDFGPVQFLEEVLHKGGDDD